MKLNIAFQGGGAKLCAMMAVADGIYTACKEENIILGTISGSSAGAIAAAILASGKDPKLFSDRARILGPKFATKLSPRSPLIWKLGSVVLGRPLLNKRVLLDFLCELFTFEDQQFTSFLDLEFALEVVYTDIQNRNSSRHTRTGGLGLIEALAQSAAIPIFLHSYKDSNDHVDGGILNNLPVHRARTSGNAESIELEQNVAITFFDEGNRRKSSDIKSYVEALISTVIEANIAASLVQPDLKVHSVYTKVGLLAFQEAISSDLDITRYEHHKSSAMDFIRKVKEDLGRSYRPIHKTEFALRLNGLYTAINKENRPLTTSVIYRWFCNCLGKKSAAERDRVQVRYTLTIDEGQCWSYGARYTADKVFNDIGDVDIVVRNGSGELVGCTTFPLTPELLNGDDQQLNLFVFFHRPLSPGDTYSLEYEFYASEVLYDLTTKGEDAIEFNASSSQRCDLVEMIAYIPEELEPVEVLPLAVIDGERPGLIKGRPLTGSEISRLGQTPIGFRAIGWTAEALDGGHGTGFVARSHLYRG